MLINCNLMLRMLTNLIAGTFFLPRDQANSKPKKKTNYEGLLYMGEYHLAWAACQVMQLKFTSSIYLKYNLTNDFIGP